MTTTTLPACQTLRQRIKAAGSYAIMWSVAVAFAGFTVLAAACASGVAGTESPALTAASPPAPGQTVSFEAPPTAGSILVVTTLYPLEYFAQRIGGESVDVVNLVAPGVAVHDFEPTPKDIRLLDAADLVVYNGSGFEPWMDRALRAVGKDGAVIVQASLGLAYRDLDGNGNATAMPGGPDPHVWLDPMTAMRQVEIIQKALSVAAPAAAVEYARNGALLIEDLKELHRRFQSGLKDCRLDRFITSHAAFGYLADRYGVRQVSITSGFSPEVEPAPRELARLADIIKEMGSKYVMVEPIISARLAETLAREVSAKLLALHPLENLTVAERKRNETYFSVMDTNLKSIRTALECA